MRASPTTLEWVALALLGIAIAAAIAIAASNLASREIGLASEPLRAGKALAPAGSAVDTGAGGANKGKPSTTAPAPSAPAETSPPPTEAAPSGGGDDGRGGEGRGGDD